jgi:glycosyltransferase involved in cell wall biosynthesis
MPLFTVVMPCYRAAATVAEAVRSVLAQDEPDLELIVVDDGSDDGGDAVALRAMAGDPRGHVLRRANAGPAAARNAGVAAGRGALVAFLDADDRWAPCTLARHRDAFAANPALGAGFARLRFYDAALRVPGRISAHHAQVGLAEALGENPFCSTSNLVLRREAFDAVGGFDTRLRHAEDQDLLVRLLAYTNWQAGGIDAELVHYRTSAAGLSADLGRMQAGWMAMVAQLEAALPAAALAAVLPPARARFHRYLARRALRTGQPAHVALVHLFAAARASPAALLAGDRRRTALTLAGALAALALPRRLIAPLISR